MPARTENRRHAQRKGRAEARDLAAELYRERRGYLLAIARRNAVSRADAEEALQDALALFIDHFDPERGAPPLAWLTLTLKRECWRRYRREHWERRAGQESERGREELGAVLESIPSPAPGPGQRMIDRECARTQLAGLNPDQRRALLLRAAGYSYKEIAAHRSWTYSKVDRCVRRGRATLRELAVG